MEHIITNEILIDLGVALTEKSLSQPVHVIFILVILLITVFFCHSLIRLCMHLLRPSSAARSRSRIPSISSRDGFNPNEPIRVHVVTDEEIAGADDEECRMVRDSKGLVAPPPAYGLWRSSVVSISQCGNRSYNLEVRLILTDVPNSELIRTSSIGNVRKNQLPLKLMSHLHKPQMEVELSDLHHICQTMALSTYFARRRDQLYLLCRYLRAEEMEPPRLGESLLLLLLLLLQQQLPYLMMPHKVWLSYCRTNTSLLRSNRSSDHTSRNRQAR